MLGSVGVRQGSTFCRGHAAPNTWPGSRLRRHPACHAEQMAQLKYFSSQLLVFRGHRSVGSAEASDRPQRGSSSFVEQARLEHAPAPGVIL